MTPPAERKIDDFTWLGDRIESFESFQHNRPLLLELAGFAAGVTERPLEVNRARWLNLFGVFTNDRYSNCRNPCIFDLSLDQPN